MPDLKYRRALRCPLMKFTNEGAEPSSIVDKSLIVITAINFLTKNGTPVQK